MPKKKEEPTGTVLAKPIEDILADRFERYSKYIIQERALPDARDGLKPVQRRILYAMKEAGNTSDKPYHKSAKTVGNVIGNYHPHGDSSVYDAMVRLSQEWKMNWPLVDMQGNNGSIDDDPAAAMRYTEARLSPLSKFLLEDIDKDTVAWAPNFSDEKMEPVVLPARYPNLLVQGISGIASGYATNIPPYNLEEVVDACIALLKDDKADLSSIVQGPDFPTGGIIMGLDGIKASFETGKGKIIVRSKCEIVESRTMNQIIVTEIPYEVVKSALVKRIDELRLNHKVEGVLDVRDESDRNGLRIAIDLKKEAPANEILNYLYKNTDLQTSFNTNTVAIVNQRPVLLSLRAALDAFLDHRKEVVLARTRYDLAKAKARAHILEGLVKAISVMDEIIALIRKSRNKAESKLVLQDRFEFTEAQAEAIVSMRLYRLSNSDITELKQEYEEILARIAELEAILTSTRKLKSVLVKELKEVKKEFPSPRKTQITAEAGDVTIDELAMIPDEQTMVAVSKAGYLKRVSLRSYGARTADVSGHKDGDIILAQGEASTKDTLLVFTDRGRFASLPVYSLPEAKWKDLGTHAGALVKLEDNENLVAAKLVKTFDPGVSVVTVTEQGLVKRSSLALLETVRKAKAVPVMKVLEKDSLKSVLFSPSDTDRLVVCTTNGQGLEFSLDQVPSAGLRTKGVKAVSLEASDKVAFAGLDRPGAQVVLFSADGHAKRFQTAQLAQVKRGAKGTRIFRTVKSNPSTVDWGRLAGVGDTLLLQGRSQPVKEIALLQASGGFGKDVFERDFPVEALTCPEAGNWQPDKVPAQQSLFED